MPEPNTQNVLHDLARAKAAIQSCEVHGSRLMQLEAEVKRAEQALRGLQAQIAQVNPMVAEIEGLDQRIRAKRSELADLDAQIAKKSEQHGSIDGELRSLMKRASSLVATN
jgi:chromosome segregation ATPase